MGIIARSWTTLWVVGGMAAFSQAPEFTQQYKQRLGGGIAELKSVVDQFDADADSQGLTREGALTALKESGEDFPRARGQSMETVFNRYGSLVSQRAALERSDPFFEPVNLLRWPDTEMLSGTYEAFKPGLQFTPQGALWALLGGILLGGIGRLPLMLGNRGRMPGQEPVSDRMVAGSAISDSPDSGGGGAQKPQGSGSRHPEVSAHSPEANRGLDHAGAKQAATNTVTEDEILSGNTLQPQNNGNPAPNRGPLKNLINVKNRSD